MSVKGVSVLARSFSATCLSFCSNMPISSYHSSVSGSLCCCCAAVVCLTGCLLQISFDKRQKIRYLFGRDTWMLTASLGIANRKGIRDHFNGGHFQGGCVLNTFTDPVDL